MSASPAQKPVSVRPAETADAGKIRLGAGMRRLPAPRAIADNGRIRLGAGMRRAARPAAV